MRCTISLGYFGKEVYMFQFTVHHQES